MKLNAFYKYLCLPAALMTFSCTLNVVNPNAASDQQVLNSSAGIIALSVGIRQYYSTTVLSNTLVSPCITDREVKGVATFVNVIEMEEGGSDISTDNGNILPYWSSLQEEMGMCENIISSAPTVPGLDSATLSGIMAQAYLFKAMSLTQLVMAFTEANLNTSTTTPVTFSTRAQVLAEAIRLLDLGVAAVTAHAPSATFTSQVAGPDFDIVNSLYAYEAWVHIMNGDWQLALDNANKVDLTKTSKYDYSTLSPNPLYQAYTITKSEFPRIHFGLPDSLVYPGDNRIAFFETAPTQVINGDTIATMAGFASSQTTSIPVYTPDEVRLMQAECILRLNGSTTDAETLINAVRTQTTGDPFGINAGLPAYSGPTDYGSLLEEVYKQRCAELYLFGLKWEDTRRFDRPAPPTYNTESNRIYWPYPQQERINNPNTPADPAI